jgi:hypothetical protein
VTRQVIAVTDEHQARDLDVLQLDALLQDRGALDGGQGAQVGAGRVGASSAIASFTMASFS